MNVVMTGRGLLVEVQGTAEGAPFSRDELTSLLDLASSGIDELLDALQVDGFGAEKDMAYAFGANFDVASSA